LASQKQRYQRLLRKYQDIFQQRNPVFFSVPGRIEICGNHTDHNSGRVLVAAITLDAIAIANKSKDKIIKVFLENYNKFIIVDLADLGKKNFEQGTTISLLKGIAKYFQDSGFVIGGFNALISSDIWMGAGLSSSASIEILFAAILNHLFNENKIDLLKLAQIGKSAENNYFGKPSGLMDQIAVTYGGLLSIDFKNEKNPFIEQIHFDFEKSGYSFLIVNTKSAHHDLTAEYRAIAEEMKAVAKELGKSSCREIDVGDILDNISLLRSKTGDRSILRALHFIDENKRVFEQTIALKNNNMKKFIDNIRYSGTSSFKWLQNIYTSKNIKQQELSLALAFSEKYIKNDGACRIHGGGFGGSILSFLPSAKVKEYKKLMEKIFGDNCVIEVFIRRSGIYFFSL